MSADAVAWVRAHARAIGTTEPGAPNDDIRFLLDLIGDARIVGLGESTHGTREFSLLKHRIVKLLVEEAGFRVLAFERDVPLVAAVDEYVLGGDARAEDVFTMTNVYPWHTDELRGVVEWMRARNAVSRDHLRFVGFDIQAPGHALERAAALLGDAHAGDVGALQEQYARCRSMRGGDTSDAWAALGRAAGDLAGRLDGENPLAALSLRTIAQVAPLDLDGESEEAAAGREVAMAENIATLADEIFPAERLIVWAHNGHVGGFPRSMGEHLRARDEADYRVIGFTFHSGTYAGATFDPETKKMDRRLVPFEANPLPDDAIEHVLHEAGIPMFALDLREAHAAFRAIRNMRLIGFVGGFEELEGTPMADAYDTIIHVDRATAAVPLPWSATEIAARQT